MSRLIDHLVEARRLPPNEMAILQYLEDYGNASMDQLKGKAKNAARAVRNLLDKGFIERAGSAYRITSTGFDQLPG